MDIAANLSLAGAQERNGQIEETEKLYRTTYALKIMKRQLAKLATMSGLAAALNDR